MAKFKRVVKWFAINTFFCYCLYMAMIDDAKWAENIVVFIVWFFLIISALAYFNKEVRANCQKRGRTIPIAIDGTYDAAITLIFVGYGWIPTAIAYIFMSLFQVCIFEKEKKKKKSSGK